MTDIIFAAFSNGQVPQVAPIFILVPVITMYYLIIRYSLMKPVYFADSDLILTPSAREKMYTNLSSAIVAGGIVGMVVQYLYYKMLLAPLFTGVFIASLGMAVRLLKTARLDNKVKDFLLVLIIFASIPSIILVFITFGGVTTWSISFLFITIMMVFNRRIVLFAVSVSILSTQLFIWILRPEVALLVDAGDYIGRIGILGITISVGFYINNIYINRLRQNADQLDIQRFISEVSSVFINVNQSNLHEKMRWVLRILGKLYTIDRINIAYVNKEKQQVDSTRVWDLKKDMLDSASHYVYENDDIPQLLNMLIHNEYIYVPDLEAFDIKSPKLKAWLDAEKVQAFLVIPLLEKEDITTILVLSSITENTVWKSEEISVIKIIANIFSDALMKVNAEEEIWYLAYHDYLTGLPNRLLLKDRMSQALSLASRNNKSLGVVLVDLDSFKSVNETLGHDGGDALLKVIAKRLQGAIRASDTVSRFGGDEFVILFNQLSVEEDIHTVTQKVARALYDPVVIQGQAFNLTSSIGAAVYPQDGDHIEALLRNADSAMYKAKENGKNQYMICTKELKEETKYKVQIMNSLYGALNRGEFYIHYQPQVELESNDITGLEALLRWNHPELGFVSPALFIPIAEQIGVIHELGEWVLRNACSQNKAWQEQGYPPVTMAVNVSAIQLQNIAFADQIHQILDEVDMDPKYLEVEITESTTMNEAFDVVHLMGEIRNKGIKISIDDFGTYYSSLARIKDLPIDKIKIDKKFVDGIEMGDKDKAIIRTIINLAKNLSLEVIAEGVEEENQMRFLKRESCDDVQGYYFYRPMSAEDVESAFKKLV
jgi:diguanylate cyclase (GGDEF)-like protein